MPIWNGVKKVTIFDIEENVRKTEQVYQALLGEEIT
jgi:hypothetical protein